MTMRVLSPDSALRLMELRRGGTELPLKIFEHKLRIEKAIQNAEQKQKITEFVDRQAMKNIVTMKMWLDVLYADWAEGVERIRWIDIPSKADITVEQILTECINFSESIAGEMGVEALAKFLDSNGYPGVLKTLSEKYLAEIRPYLEERLIFNDEVREIFQDSKTFFDTQNDQEVRNRITQYCMSSVNKNSPAHVILAMIAHIEFSLGNYIDALLNSGHAYNVKNVRDFEVRLSHGLPAAHESLLDIQKRLAEILIVILAQARQG